MIRDSNAVR